jgi:hypothetical protein
VVAVDAAQDAVRGDELDGQHVVGGQAVAAGVERQAAAEQVADDTDVRRGAVHDGEAVLGRRDDDVLPLGAGADACAQRGGIDLHLAAEVRLHEERVVQGRQRGGQVARGLGRDAQAQVAGEGDGVADLGGRARVDDAGGPQVGREVPGGAGPVVAAVDGLDDERA